MRKIHFIVITTLMVVTALQAQQYRWESIPNLTEEQKSKLLTLQTTHLQKVTDLRNSLHEKKAQLRSAMSGSTADEKKALQIAKDINALQATLQEERIKHYFAIANTLTDDQKKWWFSHNPGRLGPNAEKGPKFRRGKGPRYYPNCPYYQD